MAPLQAGSPLGFAVIGYALLVIYFVGKALYNVFLHPLRSFPGPLLWRISPIPKSMKLMQGELVYSVGDLHAKYGPIVRIGPDELAFSDPQAWKDIYGHRHNGAPELPKYDGFYRVVDNLPRGIINEFRDEHALLRRQLSHGFSERSMQAQEPIIGSYVDLLIRRLQEKCDGGATALNMREWLNWTTFDVIGDLGFGSAFGCLEKSDYHPWVKLITSSVKQSAIMFGLANAGFRPLVRIALRVGKLAVKDNQALLQQKLSQRIELGVERPDFIEGLIKKKDEGVLDLMKLVANAGTLIVAGSETTATLLSGIVYLLTTNPDKLEQLTKEVRSAFNNDDEITLTSVGKLTYMLACLNEALRLYPPVPTGMPRQSPKGGVFVSGKFIPQDTVVAVWQFAINHDPNFWTKPYTFAPERFMGDPAFKTDQLDAMQPFSIGPRNCIGRNLAYAEMRLILAKIIYNFDMSIDDGSRGWLENQKAGNLWHKPALNIYMKPVST
ncbi:cytochrome P450 ClCP1 [Hypoxylon crocopeplum]|nr:cytochrome P450 ClCP1 [Hypoxylon crocopeplum]